MKGVMFTLNQAVYPYVSSMIKREGNNKAIEFVKKYLSYYSGGSFFGGALLAIFSPVIIKILFGDGYDESIDILQLMACLAFIISISNVFGIQIMLNFGYQKVFSKILVVAALIDFFLVIPLAQLLQGYGIAITMILVESFVTICTIKCVLRYGLIRLKTVK